MKKHVINAMTLSALLLAMTQAQAADALTAELKVVGELTVPTCTVAATDDGVYDIGKQSSTVISATAEKTLTAMTKTWTVTCDAETYMNMTPVDNRAASKSITATTAFGLGNVNGTGKIGYFGAAVKNAQVDSVASQLFTSASATFTPAATVNLTNGAKTGWATAAANTQKSGKVFVADIAVTPVLASSVTMNGPITDTAEIDGSVTLNFAYGI
ncbi:DUF1120 domain-containing protein [Serratia fonticola]